MGRRHIRSGNGWKRILVARIAVEYNIARIEKLSVRANGALLRGRGRHCRKLRIC
jgi:hypothetical protein